MNDDGYFVEVGDTLSNKLGINNPKELQLREYDIVAAKIANVIANIPSHIHQSFDFNCLLELHKQLFEDIYDFAGTVRQVNIAKREEPIPFAYYDCIPGEAKRIFKQLEDWNYLENLDHEDFINKLAWLSSELNALHPFREGNGRTIRLYLTLLAANAGYLIDFSLVSHETIITADKSAFAGNLTLLKDMYRQITSKI